MRKYTIIIAVFLLIKTTTVYAQFQGRVPPPLKPTNYLDFAKLAKNIENDEVSTSTIATRTKPTKTKQDQTKSKIVDLRAMLNHMYDNVQTGVSKTEQKVGDSVHHIVDALYHASSRLLTLLIVFIFTLIFALLMFIYIRKYEHFGGPVCLTKFCAEQNLIDKSKLTDDYYTGDTDDEMNFGDMGMTDSGNFYTTTGRLPDEVLAPSAFICDENGSVFSGAAVGKKVCTALTVTNPALARQMKTQQEAAKAEAIAKRINDSCTTNKKSRSRTTSQSNYMIPTEFLSKIPSVKNWVNESENKFGSLEMYAKTRRDSGEFKSELSFAGMSEQAENEVAVTDIELYQEENFAAECLK